MTGRIAATLAVIATLVQAAPAAAATQVFFAFHRYTNTSSLLTVNLQDVYSGQILIQQSLRAGSGTSTNECYLNHGWLPAGWYDIVGHFDHYNASLIKGRVWQLSDKRCMGGTGTLRTELHPFRRDRRQRPVLPHRRRRSLLLGGRFRLPLERLHQARARAAVPQRHRVCRQRLGRVGRPPRLLHGADGRLRQLS